ncbi:MAG TPA: hypothetical protein VG992_00110 [Candidatus Saccharimonadales bacterium]|nr:hypothetical protein [Candidatus Saccharimonadales bacterium]
MSIAHEKPEVVPALFDGVHIAVTPDSLHWQTAADIEAEIFIEKDYVQSAAELADEYAPYLGVTEFVGVHRNGLAEGSTRLIFYSPDTGFKTLTDIKEGRLTIDESGYAKLAALDLHSTFEVGTLSVARDMRGKPEDAGRISVALYGAIYGEARRHDAPYMLASFDEDYFHRFKGIFGPGVQQLGPSTDYMGSPTVPVLMDINQLHDHLSANFPDVFSAAIEVANTLLHD